MKTTMIVAAMALLAGTAIAYAQTGNSASVQDRLDRIEKAVGRIEAKVSDHPGGRMMQHCSDMMAGGMMGGGKTDDGKSHGGMMGRGMMGNDATGGATRSRGGEQDTPSERSR